MASRALATTALLLTFNLLFFTLVTSTHTPKCPPPPTPKCPPPPPCPPSPKPPTTPTPKPPTTPTPKPPTTPTPKPPTTPTPKPPTTPTPKPPTTPTPKPPTTPTPKPPTTPSPKPPTPSPSPPKKETCPIDALKLGVCANLLNDLIHLVVGNPPKTPCCTLIGGLADLEAAVCLCTAIKANILGINLNVPVSLSLLLNYCGKEVPSGFQCS